MSIHKINRRKFLGQASCAGLGYTTLMSTLCNLKTINASSIMNSSVVASGDYKALVCILFSGGIDSFNMLVPRSDAEYNQYATTRSNMALQQDELRAITPNTAQGMDFGLHPAMSNFQSMFDSGRLAFIPNVGSLIHPITKTEYYNGSVQVPLGLYSHADQVQHWQTSVPQSRAAVGWGGKIADLLQSSNNNQTISMNMSMGGSNTFQTGNNTVEYSINPWNGPQGITGYGDPWQIRELQTAAIDNMVDKTYQDMFKQAYVDVIKTARDGHVMLTDALDNVTPFQTQFSNTYLSQSMKMIANTIAARTDLDMSRQIFFIDYGGWDHHDEVLQSMNLMLTEVDDAMGELYAALDEITMSDCVTTFGISEFGRTLTSNGNGTDHAWGGNMFAAGGAVNGNDIYGNFPSLELDNELEVGGGVLIPTRSADEYFAELALWYGVPKSDLALIFPNIGNFYDPTSPENPIGFMNI